MRARSALGQNRRSRMNLQPPMTADEHLSAYIDDGQESDQLEQLLSSPTERQALYRLIVKPALPHQPLSSLTESQ